MELKSKPRVIYWDNAKGLLISLVVLGHYLLSYAGFAPAGKIVGIIYFFHMPAFVLVSGFLSRNEKAHSSQAILKLAAAYILFNTIMMGYALAFEGIPIRLLEPYYSYWYLLALIVWRISAKYLAQFRWILPVSFSIAFLIGFWSEISNVMALSRIICFLPFFLIGYKLPSDKINAWMAARKRVIYLEGAVLVLIMTITAFWATKYVPSMDTYQMFPFKDPSQLVTRVCIFGVAALMIMGLALLIPGKPVPFLSKWGKNSLTIFILHRFFTLTFVHIFPVGQSDAEVIVFAFAASFLTLWLLGSDTVSTGLHKILDNAAAFLIRAKEETAEKKDRVIRTLLVVLLIAGLAVPPVLNALPDLLHPAASVDGTSTDAAPEFRIIPDDRQKDIENAVSIAFVGDLILLQDQVKNAYSPKTGGYDFSPMFEYAAPYLRSADLAVGVFEGPMAGEAAGYSTSNYADNIPMHLNFPDSFAAAVKNAGIDLVTTATNHILDKGEAGAMRTLDVLDEAGLAHTGSYRTAAEKSNVQILKAGDLKIAVLSYTYGDNEYDAGYFLSENPSLTSILVDEKSPYFDEVRMSVLNDIDRAKKEKPDLIIVLPHMGTQFTHETDAFQKLWDGIFIDAGANLVLGDHSHDIQPVEFRTSTDAAGNKRQALIVNCPGNFANSYVADDGDATSIVKVFLNPVNGDILGAGIIPMWTQTLLDGTVRALPIYDIMHDDSLQNQISTNDLLRIAEVQSTVTSVMLGTPVPLQQAQNIYYYFPDGYFRQKSAPIDIAEDRKQSELYRLLSTVYSVCFVGDSVTAGSENGGYGWYEPLMANFPAIEVTAEAWAGATTKTLLNQADSIAKQKAGLYVIAIGTNDVRYRNKSLCAMDPAAYIDNIRILTEEILAADPSAQFVFIRPWPALANDPNSAMPPEDRDKMLEAYAAALESFCRSSQYLYIDPTPSIHDAFMHDAPSKYLIDHIHPNAVDGISLYSLSVLENSL